jgi:glycosyltransferase involved in cell wall biosynthesis
LRREVVFAYPGDLDTPTGGYAYDRRMISELRALGWTVRLLSLSPRFPFPEPADLAEVDAALAAVPAGTRMLVDGLAFGAMPEVAAAHVGRLRLFALVHHPLALESGLSPQDRQRLAAGERAALATAEAVIATSGFTARQLQADYGVEAGRLVVVEPGTDPGPPAAGEGDPPLILTVAAVVPRKGHDILIEALAGLGDLPWRCRLVGALDRHPATVAGLRAAIDRHGLADRIALVGEVEDVRAEMASADLFALPSRHEGYGMAFAEAISQGLPVIGCAAGAVSDLVKPEAGLLVPPDDVAALREALRLALCDPAFRRRLAEGARHVILPSWASSARVLHEALSR